MKVRFQTDADFNRNITTGLRLVEGALEIRTAEEAGLRGKSDPEVLEYSADDERLLLTHDAKTMPIHFGEFLMRKEQSRGDCGAAGAWNRAGGAQAALAVDGDCGGGVARYD